MSIVNGTPHEINIYAASSAVFDPASRKNILIECSAPVRTLQKSGVVLNARMVREDLGLVDGISIISQDVAGVDRVPDDRNYYVVSQMYVSAARKIGFGIPIERLLCIGDPVYADPTGKQPVGVLNLQKA